ncbi:MAG: type 1 glutamine amidotransferase domain-containing protein [Tahibacter sp.]
MRILCPLPARDADPSEVAVSWKILSAAGHTVSFATPEGATAQLDPLMLSGEGLDAWGRVPVLRKLRVIGLMLRANAAARAAVVSLTSDPLFAHPLRYASIDPVQFGALLLPGGHAKGIREYLESTTLQHIVSTFFDADKPVAAICHGVVLAARSISPRTGQSVLHGKRTTALTWSLEKSAWDLTRWFARWWDPDYYRTYREASGEPAGFRSVQAEVTRALASPQNFLDVTSDAEHAWRKRSGLFRDSATDDRAAFVVRDGNYVSARWPGDVHAFARAFLRVLEPN